MYKAVWVITGTLYRIPSVFCVILAHRSLCCPNSCSLYILSSTHCTVWLVRRLLVSVLSRCLSCLVQSLGSGSGHEGSELPQDHPSWTEKQRAKRKRWELFLRVFWPKCLTLHQFLDLWQEEPVIMDLFSHMCVRTLCIITCTPNLWYLLDWKNLSISLNSNVAPGLFCQAWENQSLGLP